MKLAANAPEVTPGFWANMLEINDDVRRIAADLLELQEQDRREGHR